MGKPTNNEIQRWKERKTERWSGWIDREIDKSRGGKDKEINKLRRSEMKRRTDR